MTLQERMNRIAALEQEIAGLPAGSIATKRIKGREYYYHRQYVDGRRVERYVPAEDVETLREEILRRRACEAERKELRRNLQEALRQEQRSSRENTLQGENVLSQARYGHALREETPAFTARATGRQEFTTHVLQGDLLRAFAAPAQGLRRRACYQQLHNYVYGEPQERVFILYGLRRTGKTTLIRQILCEMSDEELATAAFLQIAAGNTLADVNRDLQYLVAHGCRIAFLDEVTLMEDFIQGAALFADIYAACGMRLVLSGTDSLGFLFSADEQLYDRCILLHTTYIPYREFESVLGIHGIDEYIRYGGTMSLGGVHYNETSTFATKERADEYVDTAIARNIQHSLRYYQYEGHFRSLENLYAHHELTGAINRVVEDINHRFTLEVLTRDFRSNDLALSARNLRRDRENPNDILDRIDVPAVTERLRALLEIRNRAEQTVMISEACGAEISEYLHLLDLVQDIPVVSMQDIGHPRKRTVIAQPGLRYAQADALIRSLLLDEEMAGLSLPERDAVCERIRSEIRGRMTEDIVLLETRLANPHCEVFVLQFPVGEFDMVVADPETMTCKIYEIKHSDVAVPEQYRHLIDQAKCDQATHRYGTITERIVLYRGESHSRARNGVQYTNVEEYLRKLG